MEVTDLWTNSTYRLEVGSARVTSLLLVLLPVLLMYSRIRQYLFLHTVRQCLFLQHAVALALATIRQWPRRGSQRALTLQRGLAETHVCCHQRGLAETQVCCHLSPFVDVLVLTPPPALPVRVIQFRLSARRGGAAVSHMR